MLQFSAIRKHLLMLTDDEQAEYAAFMAARLSRGCFEVHALVLGVPVDLAPFLFVHVVHMFDQLKIALAQDPVLKALARSLTFKLILQGEYTFEDQSLILLASCMCMIVQNMVTIE